jgi:hypothetical protein
VDKAVEWALRRPAGGRASLLLADASGRTACVEVEGRKRRLIAEGDAVLIGHAAPDRVAAFEKAAAQLQRLEADSLARLLGELETARDSLVAIADPIRHRLGIAAGARPLVWYALDGSSATA